MDEHYNDSFNEAGEKAEFIAKPHPDTLHCWNILAFKDYKGPKGDYDIIGEYRLIRTDEETQITQKKIDNIISLLNAKKPLHDLSNLTDKRVLYNIVKKEKASDPTQIIFRDYDGQGVSQDNAVLTIEKGVLQDG